MQLIMGAASHVGAVREVNEDRCVAQGHLAVVADGMGGHACGDVASTLTIETFWPLTEKENLHASEIALAVEVANAAIVSAAQTDPTRADMGTTVTGLALVEHFGTPHWMAFNVGDSRVYRIGEGPAEQITHDHSEVTELVDAGRITAEEARTHPLRHVITRSLGTEPAPDADVWLFPPASSDCFVVCSDGLTNEVGDADIAQIVRDSATPADAAARLVGAALDHGARDNVTVVVVRSTADETDDDSALAETAPRRKIQENAS